MPDTHADLDADALSAATRFIRDLSTPVSNTLGDNLIGLYLLGSLAHGGFSRRYSDLDIGLVTERGLTGDMLANVKETGAAIAPELAKKISIFWTDRTFAAGRFPPLDRLDYLDHAIAVCERERIAPARPARADVRAYLSGAPLDNWESNCARLAALTTLEPADHKPMVRAVLYAARFAYSWQTGLMASNDTAVAYLHDEDDCGLDLGLVDAALTCRRRAENPDALFARRTELKGLVDACRRLAAG
ncbi:MAG: hypothetical protein RLZ98_2518 [Pseudomonadota bacterium]|jgi:predicted nucleotidyltransferase